MSYQGKYTVRGHSVMNHCDRHTCITHLSDLPTKSVGLV